MRFVFYAVENITSMLFGLLGAAMVARVFGPDNMGRLSIVQSVSAICIFCATLGLDHFIVREFTKNPFDGVLKGSLLICQSLGWLAYVVLVATYFVYFGEFENNKILIASVVVSAFFLRVLYLKLYLQAINHAKAIAISAVISRVSALIYLVIATYFHLRFDLMILFLPIQAAVQTLIMWFYYKKARLNSSPLSFSWRRISSLVKEAFPVMLATGVYYGYSQADILLVSHYLNMHEVGIYSAAMRLIPQAAFLGHIAAMTFYASISKALDSSNELFLDSAKKILKLQFTLGLLAAVLGVLLSDLIISILYGSKFDGSSAILTIGVWAWVFMLPAALFSRLLVLKRLAKYELMKALIVAPLSLSLNIYMIPHYGSSAAAVVTVLTYAVGDFFVYAIFRETRFMFRLGWIALLEILKNPFKSLFEAFGLIADIKKMP